MVLSMEINFKFVIKLEKKKKRLSNLVHKLKTTGILVQNFESSIFEIVFADSINYKKNTTWNDIRDIINTHSG